MRPSCPATRPGQDPVSHPVRTLGTGLRVAASGRSTRHARHPLAQHPCPSADSRPVLPAHGGARMRRAPARRTSGKSWGPGRGRLPPSTGRTTPREDMRVRAAAHAPHGRGVGRAGLPAPWPHPRCQAAEPPPPRTSEERARFRPVLLFIGHGSILDPRPVVSGQPSGSLGPHGGAGAPGVPFSSCMGLDDRSLCLTDSWLTGIPSTVPCS